MKKHRVAIIGCGARGRDHVKSYQWLPEAEVVAGCDVASEKSRKFAGEFGILPYTDAEKMLKEVKPDLVHITTYPDVRIPLMMLVSDCNVPACTTEKPVAARVSDWKQLCALEARSKTRFAVSHQCRWQKNFVKCHNALESGQLGQIKFLDMSAGMNISGQGTHILNYAMAFNNNVPVKSVFGAASGIAEMSAAHPGPDTTIGYLTFANGVRALWNNGPTAPRCGDPDVIWKHVRVAAYADLGRVSWEEFNRWEIVSPNGVESGDYGGMDTWTENNLKSQADFHRAMLEWVKDPGKIPGTNLKQSLHEWKVVIALYASALERRPVQLDSFNPQDNLFEYLEKALKN
ncbi:MAG: Gfo/Idh/MocA family oxidoreductase [Verrucomicrobia bacterium]|nr:Gfo/Idh/MocA family oxidoreductase [Verrucomicrobiota bacterium]MBU1736369.1 Gfo/Idh/MocA family oxidoreductase [Verrucomicrobiota bacterium]MBU1858138.1 Gfo/Idh/MocA family oxidoreductase [Verrucomicrobiota bacterium]